MSDHDDTMKRLSKLLIDNITLFRVVPERERQEQALSFAWGNLALSTNHQPTLDGFRDLAAERYGWTAEQFDAFSKRMGWVK